MKTWTQIMKISQGYCTLGNTFLVVLVLINYHRSNWCWKWLMLPFTRLTSIYLLLSKKQFWGLELFTFWFLQSFSKYFLLTKISKMLCKYQRLVIISNFIFLVPILVVYQFDDILNKTFFALYERQLLHKCKFQNGDFQMQNFNMILI